MPCDVWRNGSTAPRVGNLSTLSGTLSGEIYERLALNKVVHWGGKKNLSVPQMISPVSQPPARSMD